MAQRDAHRSLETLSESNCSSKMSTTTVDHDTIHKALRNVPEFDGNPHILIRFLNLCDQLVTTYVDPNPGNELMNLSLLNGILNKITGSAARILATNGSPSNWQGIRSSLIHHFSDQRDESALYTDLSMLTQGSDTPQVFYEKVLNLLSIIMTYVELHDSLSTTVEAKRTLYKNLALQSYLRGLNEPLGSRIRCMRPSSLEDALKYAEEELNVIYMQNKHKPVPQRNPVPLQSNFYNRQNPNFASNQPIQAHVPNQPRFSTYRPQGPPMQYGAVHPQPGPSRTQQMFRSLPRSNMSTGFKIPPKPQMSQPNFNRNLPQPMSGISHPVARTIPPTRYDWRSSNNVPTTYSPQEMHFTEMHYPYETNPSYDDPQVSEDYPRYDDQPQEFQLYEQSINPENYNEHVVEETNFCRDVRHNAPE